jgi:branched-chain amino acid transport system permease protein
VAPILCPAGRSGAHIAGEVQWKNGTITEFAPTSGVTTLLFAFESVVIGGIGSVWGTLVGGIVLGVSQQIGAQINPAYQILAGNLVFFAVLAIRPRGLFGVRTA